MNAKDLIAQLEALISNDPEMYGEIEVKIMPDREGRSWQSIDGMDTDEGEFVIYCS